MVVAWLELRVTKRTVSTGRAVAYAVADSQRGSLDVP